MSPARMKATGRVRKPIKMRKPPTSQGDAADCMHFIVEGWVGIIVSPEEGGSTRVRSLGPHTTIGEMGLITGRSRSATIQAEVDQRALYPGHRRL